MTALVQTPAASASLAEMLHLPDVSGIDIDALTPENAATLAYALECQIANARAAFDAILAPVQMAMVRARKAVEGEIIDRGGTMLAHDTLDVTLAQKVERQKRIDILRELAGVLPDDLYREAVYVATLDVKQCDPAAVDNAVANGAKPTWQADLRKLDVHARKFGGKVAEIVAAGSPKVEIGQPQLVIKPRESAIKAVERA